MEARVVEAFYKEDFILNRFNYEVGDYIEIWYHDDVFYKVLHPDDETSFDLIPRENVVVIEYED